MSEKLGLNVGCGQRRFTNTPEVRWINVDKVSRPELYPAPDLVCDGAHIPRADNSADYFVLHHILEHLWSGHAKELISEAYRVLVPGGSLLIFIPDIQALAIRWLNREIDDYIFIVNMMGAYMGEDSDLHRWHYTHRTLPELLVSCAPWSVIKEFDWREIPGSSFAKDWWIMSCEVMK